MRISSLFVPLALFGTAAACGSVPDDPGARIYAPGGVIQGTVLYQGPRPCSSGGHIVGNAVMLVFDRQNPPPPNGLGATVVNFADVTGDVLFANEPRYSGSDVYCPYANGFTETITVSAPWVVSPVGAGSYIVQAFFDYTGDFLPTFKFRQLPESGDVGGGYIDSADALKPVNAGNPNYQAHFLEIDVGTAEALPAGSPPNAVPAYDMPTDGYVASNVTVSIGQVLPLTRPYLYPQGVTTSLSSDGVSINPTPAQSSDVQGPADPSTSGLTGTLDTDPDYMPILTIPQDILTLAAPPVTPQNANFFDSALPHINLVFGVPNTQLTNNSYHDELPTAAALPFHFQLQTMTGAPQGAFSVWQNGTFDQATQSWLPLQVPEGAGLPQLWPVVILSKLVDSLDANGNFDPAHTADPASLAAQGSATAPAVIIQGITLLGAPQMNPFTGANNEPDTVTNTALGTIDGTLFDVTKGQPTVFQQDHLAVALRPAVICFNHLFDGSVDNRGVIVTPYQQGQVAVFGSQPPPATAPGPIIPTDLLSNGDVNDRAQVTNLVSSVAFGCLPTGRYAINVIYPDGQAWTVPNEAGACTPGEGSTDLGYENMPRSQPTCTLKPRAVMQSQGPRAVVEIVKTTVAGNCTSTPLPPTTDLTTVVLKYGSPPPATPDYCLPSQQQ